MFYTAPTINREKSGIDLILRKHPTYFATDFDLLFLVDLIHVFKILELFCNAINIRIEDEPRVRFWVLLCCYCNQKTYSYYIKNCKLPSVVLSDFSPLFSDSL
jgi:hypothetical protein